MNSQQHERLLQQLQHDYDFRDSNDEYFSRGVCPNCAKRELFISKQQPFRLCCNRRNNCGFTASTFDLYRNSIFANWSTFYKPTSSKPTATADAYLEQARGFDLAKIKSLYTQEYYIGEGEKQHTATVRFTLSDGKAKWERFIDNVDCFPGQKGRALSPYKGLWWQLPSENFDTDEVWITEGIFDAISLIHAGKNAIACISSGHYPSGFFAHLKKSGKNPKIIYALDSDSAGQDALQKQYRKATSDGFTVRAAVPPSNKDWNDLWRNNELDSTVFENALYQGDLLLANSATSKAIIMYKKSGMTTFPLNYASRTYWFNLDMSAYQSAVDEMDSAGNWHDDDASREKALKRAGSVNEIANCSIEPLYFQRSRDTDNAYYFLNICRPNVVSIQNTFTGSQLGSAADFKKRLLSICPGALYEGNGKQLDRIIREKFNALRTVETIDYCGYVRDLDAWIFKDFAVANSRVIRRNKQQFIELDRLKSIKTVSDVAIELNDDSCDFSWVNDFWRGFGERGMVALAYFTGSLYVEQIRQQQQSWPFLEITGEAGTGKTTLIEFLWKLLGRADYEGFDPNKSSFSGRARSFNKVSGLPVVLIEGDHHATHNRKFEFSELKDLYNGRPIYTRGVRTEGMETNDPPFRGSIVIAQNNRVEGDEAVLSRIIPLFFTQKNIPRLGKPHVDALNRLSTSDLASYLVYFLRHSKTILTDYFDIWGSYEARLSNNEAITMTRIAHNGAQIMSMFDVIARQMQLDDFIIEQTLNYIEQISVQRQISMEADHPIVAEFWDSIDYLNSLNDSLNVNHASDDGLIAINLPHAESVAKQAGVILPPRSELNRLLPHGRNYQFIERKNIWSKIFKKAVKCLVFRV